MLDMHTRPSDILGIEDAYTAFCFDEACAYITKRIQDGEKPIIQDDNVAGKSFKRPSDLYSMFNN